MKQKIHELYLDYFNNFLTASAFAEHYNLPLDRAIRILKVGKAINYKQVGWYWVDPLKNEMAIKPYDYNN